MKKQALFLLLIFLAACSTVEEKPAKTKEEVIQEIYDMEQAFNDKIAAEGVGAGFIHFAAEDAALNRGGRMIQGKAAITKFYNARTNTNESLVWKPDYVDVSDDLTMAYTWGPYTFKGTRANGENFEVSGIFHTIWKKQQDGSWKYVYD